MLSPDRFLLIALRVHLQIVRMCILDKFYLNMHDRCRTNSINKVYTITRSAQGLAYLHLEKPWSYKRLKWVSALNSHAYFTSVIRACICIHPIWIQSRRIIRVFWETYIRPLLFLRAGNFIDPVQQISANGLAVPVNSFHHRLIPLSSGFLFCSYTFSPKFTSALFWSSFRKRRNTLQIRDNTNIIWH